MALFRSNEHVAFGFGPDRVRLVVARPNGKLAVVHADSEALPEGALRCGLRPPALADREAVAGAIRRLVERGRAAGRLQRPPELAAVVLSDGAVKMATAPIDGALPDGEEGAAMARWVLRELLPGDADLRLDWSVDHGNEDAAMLLGIGASEEVVAEYEGLLAELGWETGRVVPWTLAAAAALGEDVERTLVLCEGDGALAAVFEDAGQLRFHRAWRARVPEPRLRAELAAVERYVADHLETTLARLVVCGDQPWCEAMTAAAEVSGVPTASLTPELALAGALSR